MLCAVVSPPSPPSRPSAPPVPGWADQGSPPFPPSGPPAQAPGWPDQGTPSYPPSGLPPAQAPGGPDQGSPQRSHPFPPSGVAAPTGPGWDDHDSVGANRQSPRGSPPGRGALGMRERRSWATWQMVVAVIGTLVLGMAIGDAFAGGSSSSAGSTGKQEALPPPAASSSSSSSGSSATTTPTTTSPQTAASSGATTTTTDAASGTASVLVGPYQSHGNWTSPSFTIAGGQWNIGWAFQCSPVPASGASLEIFVVSAGGSPGSTPAVSENGASGQSVTPQSSTGSQQLVVQAPTGCVWAVKVTGIG